MHSVSLPTSQHYATHVLIERYAVGVAAAEIEVEVKAGGDSQRPTTSLYIIPEHLHISILNTLRIANTTMYMNTRLSMKLISTMRMLQQ